jgi:hypothetical protein
MRMTTRMNIPSALKSAGTGVVSWSVRVGEFTVEPVCRQTRAVSSFKKESGSMLPFPAAVTILSKAMPGKRLSLLALGLILPR